MVAETRGVSAYRFLPSVSMHGAPSFLRRSPCGHAGIFTVMQAGIFHGLHALWETTGIAERVRLAEEALLGRMNLRREEPVFMDAVSEILAHRGALRMHELARDIHVSGRHLQRVFQENMGVSPKTFASLVRYQNLWRDILTRPNRQILDEVCLLQYTDQAHLMREFKRYHGMTIPQARALAGKSVAF